MSRTTYPSGEQFQIRFDDQRLTVVEVGGGLREYVAAGRPVLDGYADTQLCDGARGQVLIPWPNRIAGGRYSWAGRDLQLPITEIAKGTAIHGLARWMSWTASERELDRVRLTCRLAAQPGYPFSLDLAVDYRLGPDGLTVTTSATNVGVDPAPYGAGAHPYLSVSPDSVDPERIDTAELRVPASAYLPVDGHGIPTGRQPVDGTGYDFRASRPIGAQQVDVAYTDLDRDDDGLVRMVLRSGAGGAGVTLWADASYPYLEIFTGDTLAPGRRRRGLGVEPMTCPPNAFATGADVLSLAPGQTTTSRWGITPRA